MAARMIRGGRRRIVLEITADQAGLYNLRTAAGTPTDSVDVIVYLRSGRVCQRGFTTGTTAWSPGTTLKLVVESGAGIYGGGGTGGAGGSGGNGGAGGPAEDAIILNHDLTIENNGTIGGGGGGGGGGATYIAGLGLGTGGGGGGGQGYNNAPGGPGGGSGAFPGTAGSSAGPGTRGLPGSDPFYGTTGGRGGNGGVWGQGGVNGVSSASHAGGVGGAAGNAIRLNGFGHAFTIGGAYPQVQGSIS